MEQLPTIDEAENPPKKVEFVGKLTVNEKTKENRGKISFYDSADIGSNRNNLPHPTQDLISEHNGNVGDSHLVG